MAVIRPFAVLVCAAAVTVPAAAQAQYYGAPAQNAPLYPYATQPNQPYAVEIAPGTYEIRRPGTQRPDAYVSRTVSAKRIHTRNDPAVIEELRQRHGKKADVVHSKKVVYDKPVVVETTRVVDDPPQVIERRRYVDDTPRRKKPIVVARDEVKADTPKSGKPRVIEADAEVTIIGPDRMSIRLFRKGSRAKVSVE